METGLAVRAERTRTQEAVRERMSADCAIVRSLKEAHDLLHVAFPGRLVRKWEVVATLDRPGRRPESYLPSQAAVESEKRVFVTAITSFAQPRLYPSALPLGLNVKGKFDG